MRVWIWGSCVSAAFVVGCPVPDGDGRDGAVDDAPAGDAGDAPAGDAGDESAVVRFVALGDAGTGEDEQYAVAEAIARVCADRACDFALYLGDNIYPSGVTSVDAPEWESHFEAPYAGLDLVFRPVMGNHDYDADPTDVARAEAQIAYSERSAKWDMPGTSYAFEAGPATFVALDTLAIDHGDLDDADAWFDAEVGDSGRPWVIAYGHHPHRSNGTNGARMDGGFQRWAQDHLCGQADVYLAGHDHNLQWLEPECGMHQLVSGAGGKELYDLEERHPALFQASEHGFVWVEIDGDRFTGVFHDREGRELFRHTVERE